jgi:Ca2+-binding EF-hand superfamily protein
MKDLSRYWNLIKLYKRVPIKVYLNCEITQERLPDIRMIRKVSDGYIMRKSALEVFMTGLDKNCIFDLDTKSILKCVELIITNCELELNKINHAFKSLDKNQDGNLSYKEISIML